MNYTISDVVETGYFANSSKGGTLKVSISFKKRHKQFKKVIDIIDYLDHSTITDNKKLLQFSERYFLLKKGLIDKSSINRGNVSMLTNIINILHYFLQEDKKLAKLKYSITVNLEKESLTLSKKECNRYILVSYSIKD
jgi:hypothetical protein